MISKKIFKPRPSNGWIWVGAIGLVLLAIGLNLTFSFGLSSPLIVMILLSTVIGIGFLLLAIFFPTMRYEVDETHLALTYGPLLRYVIDFAKIKSIRSRDPGFSPVSSFRFPGLALFAVPYPEIGTIKMCATAASTGILIIETESAKYGLTPANEEEFVAELQSRMRK